jgi:hypothetical protein
VTIVEAPRGCLAADAVHFWNAEGPEADQAEYLAVIEAQRVAWNAGDADGVPAAMGPQAMLWEDATDPDTRYSGDALSDFIAGSLWFDVETTGPPALSGLFAALPTRLSTVSDSSDPITVFRIEDGTIALQAFQQ